jgi:hypothetical protein
MQDALYSLLRLVGCCCLCCDHDPFGEGFNAPDALRAPPPPPPRDYEFVEPGENRKNGAMDLEPCYTLPMSTIPYREPKRDVASDAEFDMDAGLEKMLETRRLQDMMHEGGRGFGRLNRVIN